MISAIFCGNGPQLVQSAELFEERGGQVTAVLTSNDYVRGWAEDRGFPVQGYGEDNVADIPVAEYLFSIENQSILPPTITAKASKHAINFHGGPLPRYAGLTTHAWAIIEGEKSYGVTWHVMSETVDAGAIIKTADVNISDADTTMTLNAKCFDAGMESFARLLDDLFGSGLTFEKQEGERRLYLASKRPPALGTIDFSQPTNSVIALVRGLDFGTGANVLGAAKIWTGRRLFGVTSVAVADAQGEAGTVISVNADRVVVATADGAVNLSGFTTMMGRDAKAGDLGLSDGDKLPSLDPLSEEERTNIARAESYWLNVLTWCQPGLPPHPREHGRRDGYVSKALPDAANDIDVLGAAWASWIMQLTGQKSATLSYVSSTETPVASVMRPITLGLEKEDTCRTQIDQMTSTRRAAQSQAPMASDLLLRINDSAARANATNALAVSIARDAEAADLSRSDVILCANPCEIRFRNGCYEDAISTAIARQFGGFIADFAAGDRRISDLSLTDDAYSAALVSSNDEFRRDLCVHQAFEASVAATPDAVALEVSGVPMTYAELDTLANELAAALADRGAAQGAIVGICHERTADLIVGLLAILKTGAAYLPLDPTYPADRIAYMIEDSGAKVILASATAVARLSLDQTKVVSPDARSEGGFTCDARPEDLAYMIYTSGSTGKPKGVMVQHRNVLNFFAGMDGRIPFSEEARLLCVTSVSFDISVLEIFWTLSRGATIVLQEDGFGESELPDFSLFYFASAAEGETGHRAYRLLLEGARFADENGLSAVWTPERHFHAFGGLYPNPAVSSAAIAGMTKNIQVRGGSCVLPLHHPIRVAEDWSLVDNISDGRAGVAIASGWQPNDFVIRPQNFEERHKIMEEGINQVRALWRGEKMAFPNHKGEDVEVEIHPRPVQAEIPIWITAAGNPATFEQAGRLGCNVLTHLLGQTIEDVAEKIQKYRAAWREAGHTGQGKVALMLHTFVGESDEEVRNAVREPMKGYLKSAVDLLRRASWTSPTFKQKADASGKTPQEIFEEKELTADELDALLDHAFERYYKTSGLFGTTETAKDIVRQVAAIGVEEIACLIDFGVETDLALEKLPNIKKLMVALEQEGGVGRMISVSENILENNISHLQCTPSMASFIAADTQGDAALDQLDVLMVGGEAFPPDLAKQLRGSFDGRLFNMYGPTETTIWSSVAELAEIGAKIPLGQPIANTALSVRSDTGAALPDFVAGELWIGGEGVTKGYWNRPDLTAERFVDMPEGRFYRTGDLVRTLPDGVIEFMGRIDNQVKISGYRIELGEIESELGAIDGVREGVVTTFGLSETDKRLVGYVTADKGVKPDTHQIRERLADVLPDFMVPAQIVVLGEMPLTPNKKIDRKALPSPVEQSRAEPVEAAANDMEATISEIWRKALGLPEVSTTDNFFDLGGHSLLVVQVQRQLKESLGRDISITDVFRYSTIKTLAAHLSGDADDRPSAKNRGAARAQARLARMGRR